MEIDEFDDLQETSTINDSSISIVQVRRIKLYLYDRDPILHLTYFDIHLKMMLILCKTVYPVPDTVNISVAVGLFLQTSCPVHEL